MREENITLYVKERNEQLTLKWPHKKELDAALKRELEDTKHHFKTDEWDLNFSLIISSVLMTFFGRDYYIYILSRFLHEVPGIKATTVDGKLMLKKKSRKISRRKNAAKKRKK